MRPASVLAATVVLAALFAPVRSARAEEVDGKGLYNRKCAMCHGGDGVAREMWAKQGAKNLNDLGWQKATNDEAIAKIITDGMTAKKMPGFKDKLKPEEIAAIVKHIRTLKPAS